MPVTINHALTATTPDNPAYEIKPSAWNNTHQATISAVGSEIVGAFANSPSVTFGLSNGSVTASAIGGGGGGGNLAVSAGTTSQLATGLTFSNSNGVSFGINQGTLTASIGNQSNQTEGFYVLGNSTLSSSGTMDARSHSFSAAGLVSIGVSNGSIIISGAAGTGSGVGVSAGTQSVSNGVVTFSNSNGVTFGLNAGVLTATVNPGPAAGIGAFADGAAHTQTTGSLVFSNSNGLTFGVSTGAGAGTVTGSYTVPTVQINVSAGTTSGNQTGVTFSNSNGVSFGFNAGTITGSIAAAPVAASGSNGSFAFSTLSFGNLNGLSHYTSNGSLVASYTVPVQSIQTLGLFGLSNTTQNTSGTVNATGMSFAGAGIISVGITNGSVVISSPASTGISQSLYGTGNTTQGTSGSQAIGSILFNGAGNVSVGISNGSVVISGATAAGLTSGGAYAIGNTTGQSSSSTHALSSFNISGAGIISVGWSSNSFIVSATGGGASTAGLFGLGNTTQNSSTALNLSALSFNGLGAQTVGFSNGSIQLSVPVTSGFSATGNASLSVNGSTISVGANAAAVSIGGNSTSAGAGYSNISTGTVVLAGGPNITLSQNGATISISGGAGGGGGGWQLSAGASSQSTGTIVFSNSNNISFGLSTGAAVAGTVTASYSQSNQNNSLFALGNTTQNSSTVLGAAVLSFNGLGGNTVGFSNGSIQISGVTTAGLISAFKVSAGASSVNATAITFSNSNNITFGLSTGASVGTMTASFSQSNQNNSLFALGNTTQNSSTVLGAAVLSFNGLGAQTVGFSNGSIQLSVPATSSLSVTGGLSVSVNASTISVGIVPVSRLVMPADHITALTAPGNASMTIQYVPVFIPVSGSRIDAMIAMSGGSGATTATGAIALSAYACIYTKNGSTLSSVSSGSTQTTYTYASNTAGQTQLTASVIRPMSVPVNFLMTQGEYFVGFNLVTATSSIGLSTTNYGLTMSMMGGNGLQSALNFAEITANTATSTNVYGGMGIYSAATTGVPAAVSLSAINQTGSAISAANIGLVFRNI